MSAVVAGCGRDVAVSLPGISVARDRSVQQGFLDVGGRGGSMRRAAGRVESTPSGTQTSRKMPTWTTTRDIRL